MSVFLKSSLRRTFLAGVDFCALSSSIGLGFLIFYSIRGITVFSAWWGGVFLLTIFSALFWFWTKGHYSRRRPFWDEYRDITQVLVVIGIAESSLLFLTKAHLPRIWFASTLCLSFVLLPLFRLIVKKTLSKLGKWCLPTVIVGVGPNAIDAVKALKSEALMGFRVDCLVALADQDIPASGFVEINGGRYPVVRLGEDVHRTLREFNYPNIVIALESGGVNANYDLIEEMSTYANDLYVVPALKGLPLQGLEVNHFFRHESLFLRVKNNLSRPSLITVKRLFDILGSLTLLILLSPFLGVFSIVIKLDGGRAFFAHERIGKDGKHFLCYKFRSMVVDADKRLKDLLENDPEAQRQWERDFKLKEDPRITSLGHFLRKTSLDELPQLWNVLKGEMSLVGPRPVVEDELGRYGKCKSYYKLVRPGMTGLWQVSGRNDTDYDHRVALDAWYVKNWSLWTDIAILFKTINVVLGKKGAY